ncbi:vWA domain-containing protein [Paracoccus pacificus]|uniref:von Willebrand factor type A domain-containing protein n=1 Tax=Paracoccus pacificus TaxID=1463598 RepID=A0ABW4R2D3_9RHOB
MLSRLNTRSALAATTSVAALCIGLFIIMPQIRAPMPGETPPPAATATREEPAETVVAQDARSRENATQGDAPQPVTPAPTTTGPVTVTPTAPPATPPAPPVQVAPTQPPQTGPMPEPLSGDADASANVAAEAAADEAMPAPNATRRMAMPTPGVNGNAVAPYGGQTSDYISPEMVIMPPVVGDTEAFANADQNPVKVTAEDPVSTFSIDVDTASYGVVRSSLMAGALPPPDAVRIEEMINYFPYDYPAPTEAEAPFKASVSVMQTPWNADTQLVRIGLQGRMPAVAERPPLNLVFLIDTSGSMQDPDKLPLLKQSLRLMLGQLRPEDQVAMVAYAGSAGEVLPPTKAADSTKILAALDQLEAGGSTAGAEGLELAYRTAESMASDGEVSRILLATDGDFNVGISDPDALEKYVGRKRESGIYLSVLGFGRGNLDDATMQALAQNGNGQAAYIDTLQEAQKVLVDQLSGALFPIADDVKIQVEWNPATVAEYRLIGYETRTLAREDFNNDKVDAGEIGAGHTVTALYEITRLGSPALRNDALRYGSGTSTTGENAGADAAAGDKGSELGFLRLRYKDPGQSVSRLIETPIPADAGPADADARFAASIAGFGQLLTGAKYLGDWGWDDAIALGVESRGADPFGYRAEAIGLMRLAKSLSDQ